MSIPYELTGRTKQKARTRAALIAATRDLLAQGVTPTVEQAAESASISRTTAYRYFPNQRALLVAAHPEIETRSLLGPNPPDGRGGSARDRRRGDGAPVRGHGARTANDAAALARAQIVAGREAAAAAGAGDRLARGRADAARGRVARGGTATPRARDQVRRRDRGARLAHGHRRAVTRGGRRGHVLVSARAVPVRRRRHGRTTASPRAELRPAARLRRTAAGPGAARAGRPRRPPPAGRTQRRGRAPARPPRAG